MNAPRHGTPALAALWLTLGLTASAPVPGGRTAARPSSADADLVAAVQACLASVLQESDYQVGELNVASAGKGAVKVTGPTLLFGKNGTLGATFTAARKLNTLELTLTDGTVSLASIDRIGGGGLAALVQSTPVASSVSLRRVAIDVDDASGKVAELRVAVGTGAAWDLLPGGAARMQDVDFELAAVQPASSSRSLRGTVSGSLSLGSAALELSGTLGKSRDDLELVASLADNPVSLQDAVSRLLGQAAAATLDPMPNALRGATLRNLSLHVQPGKKSASLQTDSTLGRFVLSAAPVDGKIAFCAAFAPPKGFRLGQLDGALSSLDAAQIDMSNMALVLSSAHGKTQVALGDVVPAGSPVAKGVNLFARLDLRPLKMEKVLKVDHLELRALIPFPNPIDLKLQASIQTSIDLGSNARFKEVTFELAPNPKRFRLALLGKVDLQVDRQTLELMGEMAIEPLTQTAAVTLALDPAKGEWREPFGLKAVGVNKLAASLGVTLGAGIPLPTIGLQGGLRLGDGSDPVRGNGVVVLNPRDPMHSMVAFDLEQIALLRMIGLAAPQAATKIGKTPLGKALDALQINNVAVRIVPDDVDFAGVRFEKGFRFAGDFQVLGARARGLFDLDFAKGLSAMATVSPIRLGKVFELSGARGRPEPIVKLDLRTDHQEFLVNGKLVLLKDMFGNGKHFFSSETDLQVLPTGFSLYSKGQVLGFLDTELECTASASIANKTADFYLRARMEQRILDEIARLARDEIDRATRKHVAEINAAKAKAAKFEADVRRLDGLIAAEREKAEARRDRDIANMRKASNASKVVARAEFDRIGGIIAQRHREIAAAKRWKFPKSLGMPAKVAALGAEIGWLETRRNAQKLILDTIGSNLVKGLADIGKKFPIELASVVGPLEAAKHTAIAEAKVAQVVLDGYKGVVVGTMGAAKWIAENGIAGVINVRLMQFETRLSTQKDRFVSMQVAGKFLGNEVRSQLRLDLQSPATVARDLASALLGGKAPKSSFKDMQIAKRSVSNLAAPKAMPSLTTAELIARAR
ncbi:MAG: hypothetical protein R3F56_25585 [Planctomycetota bacterium]